jgi:hypothetical protein
MAGLLAAAAALRDALSAFDPALVTGADCVAVVEQLALTRKACAADEARAAVRAAECRAHGGRGPSDAADWLARTGGTTVGQARAALATATAAESCPSTRQALAAGNLSLDQAQVIVATEAACPGSEAELLETAATASLATLRDRGRTRRLEAMDREVLYARQRAARRVVHWRDDLGMVRLEASLMPEVGLPLVRRLDAQCDRIRRAAGHLRHTELRAAHCADALAALLDGVGTATATMADLVLVCDLAAYRRGHAEDGERCHLVGGGPVPVAVVRDLGADAFVKAVVRDGTRIDSVAHLARHIPAELRTALELGPDLDGVDAWSRAAGGATAWSGTTWTRWPTAGPPPSRTWYPVLAPPSGQDRDGPGRTAASSAVTVRARVWRDGGGRWHLRW